MNWRFDLDITREAGLSVTEQMAASHGRILNMVDKFNLDYPEYKGPSDETFCLAAHILKHNPDGKAAIREYISSNHPDGLPMYVDIYLVYNLLNGSLRIRIPDDGFEEWKDYNRMGFWVEQEDDMLRIEVDEVFEFEVDKSSLRSEYAKALEKKRDLLDVI